MPTSTTSSPAAVEAAWSEAMARAWQRHQQGAKAVRDSYELPVGLTPKDAIWRLNKATLYRYRPTRPPEERHGTPVLLVYALINRPYIFDLRPGRSFVEFMRDEGFDVYLLDWGVPGPEDHTIRFDDYATEYLPRAVRKVLRTSGAEDLTMLGYCIGAVFAVLYAALQPDGPLRNLVLLTPPLDFSRPEDTVLTRWLQPQHFDVDKVVDALGNIPAELIEFFSKLQQPVENFAQTYAMLWDRLDREEAVVNWQALHRWIHDGVPFAGEAFRQWIKEYVQENQLVRGVHEVDGRRVDLGDIRVPLLSVRAERDHLVPPSLSTSVMKLVGSQDTKELVIPAGHVGIMSGSAGRKYLWPEMAAWMGRRSA